MGTEVRKASYVATTPGVVVTANGVLPQTIGSATKTVRITRIWTTGVLSAYTGALFEVEFTEE